MQTLQSCDLNSKPTKRRLCKLTRPSISRKRSGSAVRRQAGPKVSRSSARPPAVPTPRAFEQNFEKFRTDVSAWSDHWTDVGFQTCAQTVAVVIGSGILSVILASLMAWLVGRAISRPMNAMTGAMRALAAGDNT